jgi:hypothetical protein
VLVVESTARAHNGAFCLRHLDSLSVELCTFARCGHVSDQLEAAAVFLIYDNAYDSSIRNCSFVKNRYNASYTISVVFGHPLPLPRSCVTGSCTREVQDTNGPAGGCTFEAPECQHVLDRNPSAGYDPHSKGPQIRRSKRPRRTIAPLPRQWNAGTFGAAAVASAAITAVLAAVQTLMRRLLKDRVKVPRVLL